MERRAFGLPCGERGEQRRERLRVGERVAPVEADDELEDVAHVGAVGTVGVVEGFVEDGEAEELAEVEVVEVVDERGVVCYNEVAKDADGEEDELGGRLGGQPRRRLDEPLEERPEELQLRKRGLYAIRFLRTKTVLND